MLVYLGGYLALLVWFKSVDVYHTQFAARGITIALYAVFRVAYIFYLFWIVHVAGQAVLRLFVSIDRIGEDVLDSLAINFFTGAGVWHLGMLALGFLNLYRPPVAIAITIPIVCLSSFDVRRTIARFRTHDSFKYGISRLDEWRNKSDAIVTAALGALLLATFVSLLLVKGLYPAGGHDYYLHYFPYLQTVIAQSGLWPNNVWYHFYYQKGAGLYFLSMLLTDPLAPQLVTFCFVTAASIALFQLLSRIAPQTSWPYVGVILLLGLLIYTPGVAEYRANGGWADFEKLHELNAALVIAILWMVSSALAQRDRATVEWWIAAGSATIAAIIINVTIAAYLGAVFSLLAIWLLLKGRRAQCLSCLGLGLVSGVTLLGILLLNYLVTGLIDDQGLLLFWKYADVETLFHWGALPWVLYLHWAITSSIPNGVPLSFKSVEFLFLCLRLDLLWPLMAGGLLVALAASLCRRANLRAGDQLLVLIAALAVYLAFALIAGRSQPISFYRYSSFIVSISIAAAVALWTILDWRGSRDAAGWLFGALVPILVLYACSTAAFATYLPGGLSEVLRNAWRFAKGAYSIDQAYTSPFPGRLPWGAIYPGARGAYSVVGPHTPIWSMHAHSYCMLPDCRMETFPAFIMGRDWDRLMFGSAEEGRSALQSAGLNYFLFSRELADHLGIVDVLPRSALFSPANIGRYLGIRWTDGKTALLTWAGSDTVPLDQQWLADYRHAVERSGAVNSFPYAAMKKIYRDLRAKPHPWRSFKLPW